MCSFKTEHSSSPIVQRIRDFENTNRLSSLLPRSCNCSPLSSLNLGLPKWSRYKLFYSTIRWESSKKRKRFSLKNTKGCRSLSSNKKGKSRGYRNGKNSEKYGSKSWLVVIWIDYAPSWGLPFKDSIRSRGILTFSSFSWPSFWGYCGYDESDEYLLNVLSWLSMFLMMITYIIN